jgi:hypothetical protein
MLFWSALRRSGERVLAKGILTIADIRTGAPAACTLCQRTELPLPLPDTRRSGSMPSDANRAEVHRPNTDHLLQRLSACRVAARASRACARMGGNIRGVIGGQEIGA